MLSINSDIKRYYCIDKREYDPSLTFKHEKLNYLNTLAENFLEVKIAQEEVNVVVLLPNETATIGSK